jgi:hypothetical protein
MDGNCGAVLFPLGRIEKVGVPSEENIEGRYKLVMELKDGRRFEVEIETERVWR